MKQRLQKERSTNFVTLSFYEFPETKRMPSINHQGITKFVEDAKTGLLRSKLTAKHYQWQVVYQTLLSQKFCDNFETIENGRNEDKMMDRGISRNGTR
jgi:hypothetical protein